MHMGAEVYGIDILRVQEIRADERPMRIRGGPPHVLGLRTRVASSCPWPTLATAHITRIATLDEGERAHADPAR
jgi:hypothetical protein